MNGCRKEEKRIEYGGQLEAVNNQKVPHPQPSIGRTRSPLLVNRRLVRGTCPDLPRPSQLHASSILGTLLVCDTANVVFAYIVNKLAGLPI
jgi:hypothetical protein